MKMHTVWAPKHLRFCFRLFLIAIMVPLFVVSDAADTASYGTQVAQNRPLVSSCCTKRGQCPLKQPRPAGITCYCTSPYGPIPGDTC
jgi:hypothetical protein